MSDFNASEIYAKMIAEEKAWAEKAIATLKEMMADFQANGLFEEVEVPFSGCGDSGDLDSPFAMSDELSEFIKSSKYVFDHSTSSDSSNGKVYVYDLLMAVLDGCEPGWEINEGSSGSIWLNFEKDGECKVNVQMTVNEPVEKDFEF